MNLFIAILKDTYITFRHVFFPLLVDFFPLLGFIYFARDGDIYFATSVLMLLSIITTFVTYIKDKRLPYITLYVSFITILFGLATLSNKNIEFVQMRDTLYDLSLFFVFVLGMIFRIPVLKISLQKVFTLSDRGWNVMTYGWCIFFLFTAGANEYMRRFHSFEDWLLYKEVLIPITIATSFLLYALSIYKEKKAELLSR
jgi:intracellular septation protein A